MHLFKAFIALKLRREVAINVAIQGIEILKIENWNWEEELLIKLMYDLKSHNIQVFLASTL